LLDRYIISSRDCPVFTPHSAGEDSDPDEDTVKESFPHIPFASGAARFNAMKSNLKN
jgi:hypothetical protein